VAGCGDGGEVKILNERGLDVVGITIIENEKVKAESYGIHNVMIMDFHKMDFADKTFDCVYANNSIEHAIAPYVVMCEFNRVLRDGGFTVVVIPNAPWTECASHYPYSVMTSNQFNALIKMTGFELVKQCAVKRGSEIIYLVQKTKVVQ